MTDNTALHETAPNGPDPRKIELATRVVPGGFFVLRRSPPPRSPFVPSRSSGDDCSPYRHCFTYAGGGSNIGRELITMIDRAERKIFIAALSLGDSALREALVSAADRLRGGVYVVSALDDKGLEKAINEFDDEPDIDRQLEYHNFRALTQHGIYVRGYRGLHAKFVVVDDQIALVSSANLVTRSFDEIGEDGVVVTDPGDVNRLARLFARLWQLSTWDMPPDRKVHQVEQRRGESPITTPDPPANGTGPIWTWGKAHHIATTIADIVNAARTDLILATFSIASMTYPIPKAPARPELLFDPVRRAVDRGVRVRMLIRGRNFLPSARAEATAFAEAGAEIIPDRLNHAKAAIADAVHGALFSANFMTTKGLTGGVEVGMRLDGTPALTEARSYFEHAMAEANMKFVQNPALGDLADTLYAEAFTRWPLPRTLQIVADDADWDRLAAQQGVVLFERGASAPFTLHSGRSLWRLENVDDSWLLLPKEDQEKKQCTSDTFERWLTEKIPKGVERGLCPAVFLRDHRTDDMRGLHVR